MKMTEQDYALRMAQIDEQWEARRREIVEHAESDDVSRKICEEADGWHIDQLLRLREESEWTPEEAMAWMLKDANAKFERIKSRGC
jgi:hypothetical protein